VSDIIEIKNKNQHCRSCKSPKLEVVIQTFKDGREHHRINCLECGVFNGYQWQKMSNRHRAVECHLALQKMLDAYDIGQNAGTDSAIHLARRTMGKFGRLNG